MGKKLKKFKDVDHVATSLESADYICSKTIATVVFLAQATQKPVLVEGPAGVGKTELSKAVARSLGRELIRLQCYEGLDETKALYEWEYAKQLLYTQMVKEKIDDVVSGAQNLPVLKICRMRWIALQPRRMLFFRSGLFNRDRCCRPFHPRNRLSCWWMKSTNPILNSRRFF
jgi:DNA polymerase III delta prime subunit